MGDEERTERETCLECGVSLAEYEKQEFGDVCGICHAELIEVGNPMHPDSKN